MGAIDSYLSALRPIVTALIALSFVCIWQMAGTLVLEPLLRRTPLGRGWGFTMAWLLWLPISGALSLILALCRSAQVDLLRGIMVTVIIGGLSRGWYERRQFMALLADWRLQRDKLPKILVGSVVVLQILQLIMAAHPQRLYDQLSYHLAIPKMVVSYGHSYWPFFDPHLVIGSITEYAFVWPRALLDSDFFALGVGQSWIYLVSVGTVFASTALVLQRFPIKYAAWVMLAVVAGIPGLIPDNEIFAIAKPGAIIFAGSYVIMMFVCLMPQLALPVTLVIGINLLAINPTFAHVAVALAPLVLFGVIRRRMPLRFSPTWLPLLVLSLIVLIVSVARSRLLTGTYIFPTDARFIPTRLSDQLTLDYWQWVAFGTKESFAARWLGAFAVMWRNKGLALWSGLGLLQIARHLRSRGSVVHGHSLILFFVVYSLVWPLFYDSHVFSRFVAGYTAALLATGFLATLVASNRWRLIIITTGLLGGLSASSADVTVRKLVDWNKHSLYEDYAKIFPRMVSAHTVNTWSSREDTVVTDESEKLFFTSQVLSSTLSPPEREIWREILDSPKEAALKYKIAAVVMEDFPPGKEMPEEPAPFYVPIRGAFKALAPYGEAVRVRDDWVLKSTCHFQANPCS